MYLLAYTRFLLEEFKLYLSLLHTTSDNRSFFQPAMQSRLHRRWARQYKDNKEGHIE